MPAIRYTHNGSFKIVTHAPLQPNERVPVRLKNANEEMVEWLGFICLAATNLIPGKKAKIVAREVARDEGRWRTIWQPVNDDQSVLGWLIERYTDERIHISIYGVVGSDGWPIIIDREPTPKTKKISATVTEIQRRNSAAR